MQITTIGLDIAKNLFQFHGIGGAERVGVRKQLRRSQVIAFFEALSPCLVGMKACASAHHWARAGETGSRRSPDAGEGREGPVARCRAGLPRRAVQEFLAGVTPLHWTFPSRESFWATTHGAVSWTRSFARTMMRFKASFERHHGKW
jgi:hypothetical protein